MAGHVSVGDFTVMSGMCIFHQFVRIGRACMVSGFCGSRLDLPPFTTSDERRAVVRGVNVIGLRRLGVGQQVRSAIKEAYRILYRSGANRSDALATIEANIEPYPEIKEIVEFFRTSKRGCAGAAADGGDEIEGEAI
jgi:UDP-N-acetylglucosamine acyltransferase